jgi:hypothetical protein
MFCHPNLLASELYSQFFWCLLALCLLFELVPFILHASLSTYTRLHSRTTSRNAEPPTTSAVFLQKLYLLLSAYAWPYSVLRLRWRGRAGEGGCVPAASPTVRLPSQVSRTLPTRLQRTHEPIKAPKLRSKVLHLQSCPLSKTKVGIQTFREEEHTNQSTTGNMNDLLCGERAVEPKR